MTSLVRRYRAIVCDLDGVVYRGPHAVPYAVEALNAATEHGVKVVYATNNASRPPRQVAGHLKKLGVQLTPRDVINSSVAGARVLADRLPEGATVLAVGGEGVGRALREVNLVPVREAIPEVQGVLQGYGPWVAANDLAEIAYAVQAGAFWVATNVDPTLPTDRGSAPGNGSLVAAVRLAVDHDPEVVGKPGPLMYELAMERVASVPEATLAIGDRLETDIEGAHRAGIDSLHVLTGVHGAADLVRAGAERRPRFVAEDLRALDEDYIEPQAGDGGSYELGAVTVTAQHSKDNAVDLVFTGAGELSAIERLRVGLKVLWKAIDDGAVSPEQAVAAMQRAQ